MKKAARSKISGKPKISGKREVIEISDDDSPGTRPAGKKSKGEKGGRKKNAEVLLHAAVPTPSLPPPPSLPSVPSPPSVPSAPLPSVPSPEVTVLQRKVAKMQQQLDKSDSMFQKACRSAREAELRAEQAETLLDSKRDIVKGVHEDGSMKKENEELKMKLAEVSEQLKSSNAGSEFVGKIASEQTNYNRVLRDQLRSAILKDEEDKKQIGSMKDQIFTLTRDLKLVLARDEAKSKRITELEGRLSRMKSTEDISTVAADKIRVLEAKNNSLKNDIKRMRRKAELISAGSSIETEQERAHKEEMNVMRGKRHDAVRSFNELKTKYRSLKESVEKEREEAKSTTTTLMSHHDNVLQSMYITLQQQLSQISHMQLASDQTSGFLLNENAALKNALEEFYGQVFATYSEGFPIQSMIVPPPPPPPEPTSIENPSLASNSSLQIPDIMVIEEELEDMDVEE